MAKFQLILTAFALLSIGSLSSCRNNDDPTIGEITVYNNLGEVVPGARVRLYCTEQDCIVEDAKVSNGLGITRHEFFQPMVLAIEAIKLDTTVTDTGVPPNVGFIIKIDSAYGESFITIEKNKTISAPVLILPQ
ncbi:MAG: hypothetical protein ACFB10_17020 [Salibacteraceae bacterium]